MQGKRVYPDAEIGHLVLREREYGKDSTGIWLCRPPGQHLGSLKNHDVTEHDDGTITVSPSILITDGETTWHGFLERGVWREA